MRDHHRPFADGFPRSYCAAPPHVRRVLADRGSPFRHGGSASFRKDLKLGLLVLLAVTASARGAQEADPIVRLKPDQVRRVQVASTDVREVAERSIVSEPSGIQLNPDSTTVIRAPIAGRIIDVRVSVGDRLRYPDVVVILQPYGEAAPHVTVRGAEGTVVARSARMGDSVDPNVELLTISDLRRTYMVVSIPQAETLHLTTGQTVDVAIDGPDEHSNGHIASITTRGSATGDTLEVALEVDNRSGRFRPGRMARAKFIADREHEAKPRPVVPSSAVESIDDKPVVFVAVNDTEFAVRFVTIAGRFGNDVYVERGVKVGDRVVTNGVSLLRFEALRQRRP